MSTIIIIENDIAMSNAVKKFVEQNSKHLPYSIYHIATYEEAKTLCVTGQDILRQAVIILLDIYLDPVIDPEKPGRPIGFELLKDLRHAAPWVPVVAFTGYIGPGKRTYEMSAQGFDAILTKDYFTTNFSVDAFKEIIDRAQQARVLDARSGIWVAQPSVETAATISCSYDRGAAAVATQIGKDLLESLLTKAFPSHRRVRVGVLRPGFSGASVLAVAAQEAVGTLPRSSYWIVKLDANPNILLREMRAHEQLRAMGVHHSIYPPLLHRGIIVQHGYGMLIYQAEVGNRTLLDAVRHEPESSLRTRLKALGECLNDLYGDEVFVDTFVRQEWFSPELAAKARQKIDQLFSMGLPQLESGEGGIPGIQLLRELFDSVCSGTSDSKNHWLLDQSLRLDKRQTHGDLHSENILTWGPKGIVLIDFEKSGIGLVLDDFLELETDLLMRSLPAKPLVRDVALLKGIAGLKIHSRVLTGLSRSAREQCNRTLVACRTLRGILRAVSPQSGEVQLKIAALHHTCQYLVYDNPEATTDHNVLCLWRCLDLLLSLRKLTSGTR
jgi:CheY-like chemotaxis protein